MSDKINHPPPPKCDEFVYKDGRWHFRAKRNDIMFVVDFLRGETRQKAAALAIKKWRSKKSHYGDSLAAEWARWEKGTPASSGDYEINSGCRLD